MSEITPTSIAADQDKEPETRTFRVLREDDVNVWTELPPLDGVYVPDAKEVGEAYGEGDYLIIEHESKFGHAWTVAFRVVAEKRYRQATKDDA